MHSSQWAGKQAATCLPWSIQLSAVAHSCRHFATPWTAAHQASLSITNSQSLLKLKSIESVMPSNHLILCRPLLRLPSILPSVRVLTNESTVHIRWARVSVSFSISASKDWSPLGWTCWISLQSKGLSKVFSHTTVQKHQFFSSAFFMVQFSHPNMTTVKTIALTRQTFIGKVMFLLFNMLSRFVIAFLPSSKHLLISWLQSPSAVILEPRKLSLSLFPLCPHLFAISDGTRCHDLSFLKAEF